MNRSVQCLLDAGLLTQEQADSLSPLIAGLPRGEELEKLSVASMILGLGSSGGGGGGSDGVVSSSTTTVSTGSSNVKDIVPTGSKSLVTPSTNNIVFTLDGTSPTPTSGHFAAQGSNFYIYGPVKFASFDTSSATVYVSHYE